LLDEPDSLAITEGILGLARAFRRTSIAEGVETLEHGVILLYMGCDLGQGYGIARPMPAASIPSWVANYRPAPAWQEAGAVHWSREDFPLLTMEAEHRRWVNRLVAYAEDGGKIEQPIYVESSNLCNFGRWYRNEGFARYGHLAEFRAIDPLHAEVHTLGAAMVETLDRGNHDAARARIAGVLAARDRVLAALHTLQTTVLGTHS